MSSATNVPLMHGPLAIDECLVVIKQDLVRKHFTCGIISKTTQILPVFTFMYNFSALVHLYFNRTADFHKNVYKLPSLHRRVPSLHRRDKPKPQFNAKYQAKPNQSLESENVAALRTRDKTVSVHCCKETVNSSTKNSNKLVTWTLLMSQVSQINSKTTTKG